MFLRKKIFLLRCLLLGLRTVISYLTFLPTCLVVSGHRINCQVSNLQLKHV